LPCFSGPYHTDVAVQALRCSLAARVLLLAGVAPRHVNVVRFASLDRSAALRGSEPTVLRPSLRHQVIPLGHIGAQTMKLITTTQREKLLANGRQSAEAGRQERDFDPQPVVHDSGTADGKPPKAGLQGEGPWTDRVTSSPRTPTPHSS